MIRLVPNSNGEDSSLPGVRAFAALTEFNHCHNPAGSAGGQFCSAPGERGGGGAAVAARPGGAEPPARPIQDKRPKPVKVKTVEEALQHILQGTVVEVEDVKTVHTLLTELAKIAADAKAKQEKAPNYDLCKVTVAGSNLFCAEKITTKERPEGYTRITMPQLTAEPLPGTPADQLPRKPGKKTVDAALAYVDYLEARGVKVGGIETVPAASLKATQSELLGPEVGGMMANPDYDPAAQPIFISRDNYVLDGHHRWAAVVGRDAEDNQLGTSTMRVVRIDAPMSEILMDAIDWTKRFGLKPKAAFKK